jgi:hypothetical protein
MNLAALTVEDILAAARALGRIDAAGGAPGRLDRAAARLLARMRIAEARRRGCGRPHPRFGDGTLGGAAALMADEAGGPPPDGLSMLRGAASICVALAAEVERTGGQAAASCP